MSNNTQKTDAWSLFRNYNQLHNTLPMGDLDTYSKNMVNEEASQFSASQTPDDYGPIQWAKDTWYGLLSSYNGVNRDTEYGKALYDNTDIEDLTKAQQYLQTKKQLQTQEDALTTAILNHDVQQENAVKQNIHALNTKIFSEGLNTAYQKAYLNKDLLSSDIDTQFDASKNYDSQIQQMQSAKNLLNQFKQQHIKSGNDYQNNVDYYDNMESNYWKYKSQQNTPMSLTDPDTYLYKMPGIVGAFAQGPLFQLGGLIGSYLATTLGPSMIAGAESGSLGGPISSAAGTIAGAATALGGAALAIGSNIESRGLITAARAYNDYKQNVLNKAAKANVNMANVYQAARDQQYQQTGELNTESNDNLLDDLLLNKVASGNSVFDRAKVNAFKGLNYDVSRNNALAASDIANDVLMVTPVGRLTQLARKVPVLNKLGTVANGLGDKVSSKIDDILRLGINNVPENLNKINTIKRIANIDGRIMLTGVNAGNEMGISSMIANDYQNGNADQNPSLLKSIGENLIDGPRSTFAALTPFDPQYSSDQYFLNNYKTGALGGMLATAVLGGITNTGDFIDQSKVNKVVGDAFTNQYAAKDFINRNRDYSKAAKYGNDARVNNAFDTLKSMNIPDLTPELFDAEKKQAAATMSFSNRQSAKDFAKNNLGIDPKSSDYDTYVALNMYYRSRADIAHNDLTTAINNANQSDESREIFDNYQNELSKGTGNVADQQVANEILKQKALIIALQNQKTQLSQIKPNDDTREGYTKVMSALTANTNSAINTLDELKNSLTDKSNISNINEASNKYAADLSQVYDQHHVSDYTADSTVANADAIRMSPY